MKIYCMSDIHGCYSALCDALELVIDHLDEPDTKLIFYIFLFCHSLPSYNNYLYNYIVSQGIYPCQSTMPHEL